MAKHDFNRRSIARAERLGYQRGYAAGRRIAVHFTQDPFAHSPSPPTGTVYRDMARGIASLEMFFKGLVDEYPHCFGSGRMDKWAAAAHAYIDFIACEDKPVRRNLLPPTTEGGHG